MVKQIQVSDELHAMLVEIKPVPSASFDDTILLVLKDSPKYKWVINGVKE